MDDNIEIIPSELPMKSEDLGPKLMLCHASIGITVFLL